MATKLLNLFVILQSCLAVMDLPVYHITFEPNQSYIVDNLFFFKIKAKISFHWEGPEGSL